ncbi:LacI family transcriptional regulator [Spirochaetia bacterium]|nr:LacI family transcriptional regulator [Spirochaetia bacterium]
MRSTLKDLARETGLSVATVSLVLNKKRHKIPTVTQERIFTAAQNLNYRPNQLAVSLVKQQSMTIGVIVPDISKYFFSEFTLGVEEEARRSGFNIILSNSMNQWELSGECLEMLSGRCVDAIIMAPSSDTTHDRLLKLKPVIEKSHIPTILIGRDGGELGCSFIIVNQSAGAYQAIKHLLDLGHRKIALLTGSLNLSNTQERIEGCRRAFEEAGIAFDPSCIFEGQYDYDSGLIHAEKVAEAGYTAVFAFSDTIACGVYRTFIKKGIRIPQDISVVGFDNVPFAQMLSVPLTTINQLAHTIGMEAAACAIRESSVNNIAAGVAKKRIIYDPELIERESTCPPLSREDGFC